MTSDNPEKSDLLLRITVALAVIGLVGVLPLLWLGFTPLTMGFGMLMGFPGLGLSMLLYCVTVVRDLRRHGLV